CACSGARRSCRPRSPQSRGRRAYDARSFQPSPSSEILRLQLFDGSVNHSFTIVPPWSAGPRDTLRRVSRPHNRDAIRRNPMAVNPAHASAAPQITGAIRQAAQSTGISFEYLLTTAKIESNLNPSAQASTSSAKGLYQFIDQTWLGT